MKSIIVIISLCFFLGACERHSRKDYIHGEEIKPKETLYPYSEIAQVYDIAVDALTDTYFSKDPELDKEHTAKLKSYIKTEYSSRKFVQLIVRGDSIAIFDRAIEDKSYRDTQEFKDTFSTIVTVSVSMAKNEVVGLRNIYVSRYIEKDPIKLKLFEIATKDDMLYVSWVNGEVASNLARKQISNSYEIQNDDQFFEFSSPNLELGHIYGYGGFLQVRDDKIIHIITTGPFVNPE